MTAVLKLAKQHVVYAIPLRSIRPSPTNPRKLLDRLLHHAHVLKCGPRSWRTKIHTDLRQEEQAK